MGNTLSKSWVSVLLVVALTFLVPVAVAQAAPTNEGALAATATANLRMRTSPTTDAVQLSLLPQGATVPVLGRNEAANWLYVDYAGTQGWVAAWYTVISGDISSAPVVGGQAVSSQPPAPPPPSSNPEAAEVIRLINQTRCQQGVPPLVENVTLASAAAAHAGDMASQNYFSHTAPDGRGVGDRLSAFGYGFVTYGENLAAGRDSAGGTFWQWMGSPPHQANMLNPAFTEVGVSHVYQSGTTYGHYWVLEMGSRHGVASPSCAALGY